ncbi:MAG: helix-turn-helix transcriptional regulator [Ponticaulis sp.]|nr:helix-turn-helix transcriptional regulator [Ponticaulis sp.]
MFALRRKSRRRPASPFSWVSILLYGAILAGGMLALQWLDVGLYAFGRGSDWQIGLAAFLFLCLGIWVGARLFAGRSSTSPEPGNPNARAALGISDREYDVLQRLSEGLSNKQIADALHISPNTVKTHVNRLFEKLDVSRRTEAIARARELGILI